MQGVLYSTVGFLQGFFSCALFVCCTVLQGLIGGGHQPSSLPKGPLKVSRRLGVGMQLGLIGLRVWGL